MNRTGSSHITPTRAVPAVQGLSPAPFQGGRSSRRPPGEKPATATRRQKRATFPGDRGNNPPEIFSHAFVPPRRASYARGNRASSVPNDAYRAGGVGGVGGQQGALLCSHRKRASSDVSKVMKRGCFLFLAATASLVYSHSLSFSAEVGRSRI